MHKYVYLFTEGNADMRNLLGGKGANLAEMTNIGLPVPQGFTITTEACTKYYEDGREINEEIQKIKEEFIEKFQDAYSALKDRNSREHYIDLLKEIKDDKAENGNNHDCKGGEEEWAK